MNLEDRVSLFVRLGKFLNQLFSKEKVFLEKELELLKLKIQHSINQNNWFTEDYVLNSLRSLSNQLTEENLDAWITPYNISDAKSDQKVLIVMAGNIPLVGFHDLLSVIITGNKAVVKLSSKDSLLIPCLWQILCKIDPNISDQLEYIDDLKERKFDMVIATGSDNSFSYFEYYFKDIKRLIRKNRTSVAVIDGSETIQDLDNLANDVFMYFGLGCRSVSKLFLPKGYDLDKLFSSFYSYNWIINHKKYANNYDYNKAVMLMGKQKIIENGFLIMKEDPSFYSPVSMLHYEYYTNLDNIKEYILLNSDLLQCVISKDLILKKHIGFGKSQNPKLWDYADNIDTIDFLIRN